MRLTYLLTGVVIGVMTTLIFTNLFKPDNRLNNKQKENTQLKDAIQWQWPDSLDAVKAAPDSHKVLFENDKIRILEVTVDPYGFEPMHTHRYPSVMFGPGNDTSHYDIIYYKYDYDSIKHVYYASDSIHQRSGGAGTGEHFMKPEGPHRIKNLSNVRFIAFGVEFK